MKRLKLILGVFLLGVAGLGFAGYVDLSKAANSSLLDAKAGDGRGGWIDLGGNDLHVLKSGKYDFSGVGFQIPACKSEDDRVVIVLGLNDDSPDDAELEIDPAIVKEGSLYLFHACAKKFAFRERVGEVELKYRDGSKDKYNVRYGRDVACWAQPFGGKNAVRVWSEYNHNTQVSLFLSRFAVNPKKELVGIEFEADDERTWMIVAASFDAPNKTIRGLPTGLQLTGSFRSPAPPKAFPAAPSGQKPENVILIIGDGMGKGAIDMHSLYQFGKANWSYFCHFPVTSLCTTRSANSEVTDSAAAGTAIATGEKTSNGVLGMKVVDSNSRKNPTPLISFAKKAHERGMKVALITQDVLTGATPGAFYANVTGRGEAEKIALQASRCGYEVLIGRKSSDRNFLPPGPKKGIRRDGEDLLKQMAGNGYAVAYSQEEFGKVPVGKKVIGFWDVFGGEEGLADAVETSLKRIGGNKQGFFLMAECYITDTGGHGNRPEETVMGITQIEWMAKRAMDFALKNGKTLVVVTSDHETGAISAVRSASGQMHIHYGDTSHTREPVPVYAFGPGAERFDCLLDNTDLARIIGELLELK